MSPLANSPLCSPPPPPSSLCYRRYRLSLIRHALFGEDSFRFAAMLGRHSACSPCHPIRTLIPIPGSFVGLYKFILNALPLLLPQPEPREGTYNQERALFRQSIKRRTGNSTDLSYDDHTLDEIELGPPIDRTRPSRQARLSASAQAHQVWVRKKTRWWYSACAGSVAGAIAILFEKRSRQVGIAQQMFVRYVVLVWADVMR